MSQAALCQAPAAILGYRSPHSGRNRPLRTCWAGSRNRRGTASRLRVECSPALSVGSALTLSAQRLVAEQMQGG